MMEQTYLDAFEREEFSFEGAWCFRSGSRAVLLSRHGTTLVLSGELADTVAAGTPCEDLCFKLYQRGFGRVYGRERFVPEQQSLLPTFFMIDFTTQCNCNCIYCLRHFENVGQAIDDGTLADICRYIADYCHRHRIDTIGFQPWGGEPLFETRKIYWVQDFFASEHIRVKMSVQTNGLLLTPRTYEELNRRHIGIGVSVDGGEASHDAHRVDVRGNVTHARIVRNMDQIRAEHPDCQLGTISVNSHHTLPHIRENIAYLVEQLDLHQLKFNLVHPNGDDFDYSMLITPEEIPEYVDKLFDGLLEQIHRQHPCVETNLMDKAMNLLCRPDNDLCHSTGCHGGYGFISFDQKGNIYPCEMIGSTENCLGSIYDGIDLAQLLAAAQGEAPYFQPRELEECGDCPWKFYCRGGCKASAMAYGRKPCQVDHIECAVNKAVYPRLMELLLEEPETLQQLIDHRIML